MAYFTPPTVSSGDTITSALWNTYIRSNMVAGVPDIFAVKGDIAVASAADAAARLGVSLDFYVLHCKASATNGLEYSNGVFALVQGGPKTLVTATIANLQPATVITDTYSFWSGSPNFRFVCPAGFPARHYAAAGTGYFTGHATVSKYRLLEIRFNGATIGRQATVQDDATNAIGLTVASPVIGMTAGDYIELWGQQNSGGNLDFNDIRFGLYMIR